MSLKQKARVVDIVKYEDPRSFLVVAQPVVHELKHVRPWVSSPRDLRAICNVPKALLKAGGVARMHPENPRFQQSLADSVRVFDGELRLASQR